MQYTTQQLSYYSISVQFNQKVSNAMVRHFRSKYRMDHVQSKYVTLQIYASNPGLVVL